MQPEDPFNLQPPAAPDLPDAALPTIEPVPSKEPVPQTSQNPLLPEQPVTDNAQTATPGQGRDKLSTIGEKYFDLIEFDPKEELLLEIRKHPFGLLIILLTGFFIAFVLFFGVVVLAGIGFLNSLGFGGANALVVFIGFLLSMFVVVITFVNAHLYRNNVVFVTNEKLAQILFITLFNRKISQLSIGDVQDVTVQQNGFLPNLVGYGTLVVETAGEQQNYTFTFVPKPYETSKVIINAHEKSIHRYGN